MTATTVRATSWRTKTLSVVGSEDQVRLILERLTTAGQLVSMTTPARLADGRWRTEATVRRPRRTGGVHPGWFLLTIAVVIAVTGVLGWWAGWSLNH